MRKGYTTHKIEALADLKATLKGVDKPVVLLEGRREVAKQDRPLLGKLARLLVEELPNVTFRSGNAEGSDTLFAEAVTAICPERFEYVVPRESMGRKRRHRDAYCIAASDLQAAAEERIVLYTNEASPDTERLLEAYTGKLDNARLAAMGGYLVRDTLKVAGDPELGLRPASAAIFYADPDDPFAGGTGHTVRVCLKQHVPFVLQDVWKNWVW
jgi:hypothetical protein